MSTSNGVRPGFLDQREITRRTGAKPDQLKYIRRRHLKEKADWYSRERAGLPAGEPLHCYRLAPVQKALKKVSGDFGAKLRAWWQKRKRVQTNDGDDERVTISVAAEIVGVSQFTIRTWSDDGFPCLEGNPRPDVKVEHGPGDLEYQTWLRSEMEEWKRVLLRAPREPNDEDVYTLTRTAKLTGIPVNVLRHPERRPSRLISDLRPVLTRGRRPGRRPSKASGRSKAHAEWVSRRLVFRKASVDAFLREVGGPGLPAGTMTTAEAAEVLGVTTQRVTRWLAERLLRGCRVRTHWRRGEVRPWSIETESVRDLQKAIGAIGGLRRRPGLWKALKKEVERIRAERSAAKDERATATNDKRPAPRYTQSDRKVFSIIPLGKSNAMKGAAIAATSELKSWGKGTIRKVLSKLKKAGAIHHDFISGYWRQLKTLPASS